MKDIFAIKRATESLNHADLKTYLNVLLVKIKSMKEQIDRHEIHAANLIEIYDEILQLQQQSTYWDPVQTCTHVHIVIGESFAGSMKLALTKLGWADFHKLITFKDNYAIGPLGDLDVSEVRRRRSEWFLDHITDSRHDYDEYEDEYKELLSKLELIPEHVKVVLWVGNNAFEQIGMRHAAYLLSNRRHGVMLCNASAICEELYNRPKSRIDYLYSGEITSTKLQEAILRMNDSCGLRHDDITRLANEWKMISEQTGTLRIWQDGAVIGVPADYDDAYLMEKLDKLRPPKEDNDFLKAARLIGEAIGYSEQYIGDSYFEYRLRELIYNGVLEIKGIPAAMRYYSIRRKPTTKTNK